MTSREGFPPSDEVSLAVCVAAAEDSGALSTSQDITNTCEAPCLSRAVSIAQKWDS